MKKLVKGRASKRKVAKKSAPKRSKKVPAGYVKSRQSELVMPSEFAAEKVVPSTKLEKGMDARQQLRNITDEFVDAMVSGRPSKPYPFAPAFCAAGKSIDLQNACTPGRATLRTE